MDGYDMPTSRINRIIDAVNRRYPKEAIGIEPGQEERLYASFWSEAETIAAKYGEWPTFALGEIESDDPILDIYGGE